MGDCEFNSMLSPYFDGELDEIQQRRVERHLGQCDECAAELERIGALSVVLAVVAPAAGEPSVATRTVGPRSTEPQRAELVGFVRRLTVLSAAAAALALAVNWYTADDRPQAAAAAVTATLSSWERAAIDPVPTDNSTATASADSQFDDFLVHDLGGISE